MSNDSTLTPFGAMPLTMSSREIAELVEARHNDVVVTIERQFEKGVLRESRKTLRPYSPPGGGRPTDVYDLTKRDTLVVVSGYDDALRAKIIDRWIELEAAPTPFAIPRTLGEALRLAADQQDVIDKQYAQIEADKPKTGFYDQFINADGLYGLQNAARALNCRPNLFSRWLKEKFMFYQGTALVPRVQYIQMGIFEVKSEIVEDKARPRSFITPKGLEYLSRRVPDHIRMSVAA